LVQGAGSRIPCSTIAVVTPATALARGTFRQAFAAASLNCPGSREPSRLGMPAPRPAGSAHSTMRRAKVRASNRDGRYTIRAPLPLTRPAYSDSQSRPPLESYAVGRADSQLPNLG
jgi:hypothetical protein